MTESQAEYVFQECIMFSLRGQDDRKCLYCLFLGSTKGKRDITLAREMGRVIGEVKRGWGWGREGKLGFVGVV